MENDSNPYGHIDRFFVYSHMEYPHKIVHTFTKQGIYFILIIRNQERACNPENEYYKFHIEYIEQNHGNPIFGDLSI